MGIPLIPWILVCAKRDRNTTHAKGGQMLLELQKKLLLLPVEPLVYCPFHQRIHQANYRNPVKKKSWLKHIQSYNEDTILL